MTRPSAEVRKERHKRLTSTLSSYRPQCHIGKTLIDAALSILGSNPIDDDTPPNTIAEDIRWALPEPRQIFTEEYFKHPAFPTKALKDVAALYDCLSTSGELISSLDAPTQVDPIALAHVWLAFVFRPDREFAKTVVESYKTVCKLDKVDIQPRPDPGSASISGPSAPPATPQAPVSSPEDLTDADTRPSGDFRADVRDSHGPDGDSALQRPFSFPVDTSKKASTVQMYFKDKLFTGDRDPRTNDLQSIHTFIRDYAVCAEQQILSQKQKASYFVNVFGAAARDFFLDHRHPNMTYGELVRMMLSEYDSDARQLEAQSELEVITLSKVMQNDNITNLTSGLDRLVSKINVLTPQCPLQFRSEQNKIRFLRAAVLDQSWAEQALSQITTQKFSYNRFVTALRERLQFHLERNKGQSAFDSPILYQQYGRRPPSYQSRKPVPQPGAVTRKKNPLERRGNRMLCRKCGSDEHFERFHAAEDAKLLVRERLAQGPANVHLVAELVKIEDLAVDPLIDEATVHEEVHHLSAAESSNMTDLEAFERLASHVTDPTTQDLYNEIDEVTAVNHIASHMRSDAPDTVTKVSFDDSQGF